MNSFIASSAKRDLQRTLHVRYVWARAPTFKPMLAEFRGQEKRRPVWRKGLFFQDKTAEPGAVRDKIPRYLTENARESFTPAVHVLPMADVATARGIHGNS